MDVIQREDIARLVLGYLRNQNLEKAANVFCKTSPDLKDEYHLMKKGYRRMNLGNGQLMDIIKEYGEIQSKVMQFIETLPRGTRTLVLKHNTVSSRISVLLEQSLKGYASDHSVGRSTLKRHCSQTSLDSTELETTQIEDLPGYSLYQERKRRRLSGSYLMLSNNRTSKDLKIDPDSSITATSDTDSPPSQLSKSKRPSKGISPTESENTSKKLPRLNSIPIISETLLENSQFQDKLAQNINKALQESQQKSPDKEKLNLDHDALNKQLDDMIKSILDATEKDPAFDEIVQEVVYTATKAPQNRSPKATQTIKDPENNGSSPEQRKPNIHQLSTFPTVSASQQITSISRPAESTVVASPQNQPSSTANNSFNLSLLDPNLSISKLIVLNPNESLGTQLSSDQLISTSGISNLQGLTTIGDQVIIDVNTGQMTIPITVNGDTMSFPLLINNEAMQDISQAVGCGAPKVEVEASESMNIAVPPLQAPQNSIVMTIPPKSSIKPTPIPEPGTSKGTTAPLSLESRLLLEKSTPSTKHFISQEIRSLSTPRRRTSHVRVLNFTTPLKACIEDISSKKGKNENVNTHPQIQLETSTPLVPQKVENVIVPEKFPAPKQEVAGAPSESSNSNSVDFAVDKSNETVIMKYNPETPKRKSIGRRVVRNLSQSNSQDENSEIVKKKRKSASTSKKGAKRKSLKKEEACNSENVTEKKMDPFEEWQRMRTALQGKDFDQHLRELEAQAHKNQPRSTKKRRCKIGKKNKSVSLSENKEDKVNNEENEKYKGKTLKSDQRKKKKTPVKKLLNFKISSPISLKSTEKAKRQAEEANEKKEVVAEINSKNETETGSTNLIKRPNQEADDDIDRLVIAESEVEHSSPNLPETVTEQEVVLEEQMSQNHQVISNQVRQKEMEKRTENISHLLETPFKITDPLACPITPRFLIPEALDTPITKLMKSVRDISATKHPDIATPNYAITPGLNLTPQDKETPRSGHRSSYATDYSSGGSYYKPDESDDLDRHLDRMLRSDRLHKAKEQQINKSLPTSTDGMSTVENVIHKDCVETNLETKVVPVPAVLERVKSFSDEQPLNLVPHYTFVEGLPESINESVSSDSSTSSSSSSSSSSDDSSSSDSTSMSLSDIDSSEDEDWKQKPVEVENTNENSLISQDGEVRYPVRSWITPKKQIFMSDNEPQPGPSSTVKTRKCTLTSEKQSKRLTDLEEKRLRMKEKLKGDLTVNTKHSIKVVKREVAIVTKKNNAKKLKVTPVKRMVRSTVKKISPPSRENSKDVPFKADNQVDMLKALNLSKKSNVIGVSQTAPQKPDILYLQASDNAVMNENFEGKTKIEGANRVQKAKPAVKAIPKRKTKFIDAIALKQGVSNSKRGVKRKSVLIKKTPDKRPGPRTRAQKAANTPTVRFSLPEADKKKIPSTPPIKQPKVMLKTLTKRELKSTEKKESTRKLRSKKSAVSSSQKLPESRSPEPVELCSQKLPESRSPEPVEFCSKELSIETNSRQPIEFQSLEPLIKPHSSQPSIEPHSPKSSIEPHSPKPSIELHSPKSSIEPHSPKLSVEPHSPISSIEPHSPKSIEVQSAEKIKVHSPESVEPHSSKSVKIDSKSSSETIKSPRIKDSLECAISKPSESTKQNIQPIQILEIRSSVEDSTEVSQSTREKEENPTVTSNTIEEETQKEDSNEDDDDDDDEFEDPYDSCKFTKADENDVCFRSIIYDGSDDFHPNKKPMLNVVTSVMNIFVDGQPHVLKVTNEMNLFSASPNPDKIPREEEKKQLIKNIPKKRDTKAHIESSSPSNAEESVQKQVMQPSSECPDFEDFEESDNSLHTSTPMPQKLRIIYKQRESKFKSGKRSSSPSTKCKATASTSKCESSASSSHTGPMEFAEDSPGDNRVSSSTPTQPLPSPKLTDQSQSSKIKSEDIFAVLSHLHGNDKEE